MSDVSSLVKSGRRLLHAEWTAFDGFETDQDKGLPVPPPQKPIPPEATIIALPAVDTKRMGAMPLGEALALRRSRRKFTDDALSLDELAYLLWATQGVAQITPKRSLRTAPSGGARHSLETYLFVFRVNGVQPGIWRYQPYDRLLVHLGSPDDLEKRADAALMEQSFGAAAVFAWTTVPYRMEWRYAPVAHKVIALDAGHVCQNLYLACESIGCGTCALGAYEQDQMDALLGVDGVDEFTLYAAPVGRKPVKE
jgi:SagB-type dehydrogenase family enzyme